MRIRSLLRFRVSLTVVLLALIGGCAAGSAITADSRSTSGSTAPSSAFDSMVRSTPSPAPGAAQPDTCDGVPAPSSWRLLSPSVTVVAAVVCVDRPKYITGQGFWNYRQVLRLPAAHIPALGAGLTKPDVKLGNDAVCDLVGIVIPPFVVTLADGTRLRPSLPSDGCHPSKEVLTALDAGTSVPLSQSRTKQVLGEVETITNCGDGAKSPAIWISALDQQAGKGGRPTLPSAGSVSVCYYRTTGDQEGELTRAGTVPVQQLKTLWTKLPAGPSSACPPTPDVMNSPSVDWLMFLPTPRPPYRLDESGASPIAVAELGGCRRLSGLGVLGGDVPAALAGQLAALADRAVH